MATDAWGEPARIRELRPALAESYAGLFHAAGLGDALFLLPEGSPVARALDAPRLERAVGVIYRPATERQSHYFQARLSRQFDAVIHLSSTRALTPLC